MMMMMMMMMMIMMRMMTTTTAKMMMMRPWPSSSMNVDSDYDEVPPQRQVLCFHCNALAVMMMINNMILFNS